MVTGGAAVTGPDAWSGCTTIRSGDRGELRTYPGRVTPVSSFLMDVDDALAGE